VVGNLMEPWDCGREFDGNLGEMRAMREDGIGWDVAVKDGKMSRRGMLELMRSAEQSVLEGVRDAIGNGSRSGGT
jgi:hypothetical protein